MGEPLLRNVSDVKGGLRVYKRFGGVYGDYVDGRTGWSEKVRALEEFLHHENILDEQISYMLPERLLATKDSYNVSLGIGRLFCWDEEEMRGIYGVQGGVLWNTTGGLRGCKARTYSSGLEIVIA